MELPLIAHTLCDNCTHHIFDDKNNYELPFHGIYIHTDTSPSSVPCNSSPMCVFKIFIGCMDLVT